MSPVEFGLIDLPKIVEGGMYIQLPLNVIALQRLCPYIRIFSRKLFTRSDSEFRISCFFISLPVYEFYFSFVVAAFCPNNYGQRIRKNEFRNSLLDPLMSLFTSNCYLKVKLN